VIRIWHVPISGFTQSLERMSGIETLWLKLRQFSQPDISVLSPLQWKSDWRNLAEFMWRTSSPDDIRVRVYAYSWGCGHGFVRLAKELRKRGIPIDNAVLSDPVYHSWVRPWRAVIFSPAIKIPDNVRRVDWFFQRQNRPQATTLMAQNPEKTIIAKPRELQRTHEYMDDAVEFHEAALSVAGLP